jgi:hypothetical protein
MLHQIKRGMKQANEIGEDLTMSVIVRKENQGAGNTSVTVSDPI